MLEVESLSAHGHFRDLCGVYGDNCRPVFLKEFLHSFVRNADEPELAQLRRAVSVRAASIAKNGKKGRPRAQGDPKWIAKARKEAWQRFVEGWNWPRIVQDEGLKPTKANARTVKRRVDTYAGLIWDACSWAFTDGSKLETNLATAKFRQWLWVRVGLFGPDPDSDWIAGCTKLVMALYPRGARASGEDLARLVRYRANRKRK